MIEHLPRVQKHCTASDTGDVLLDLISLHHGMPRQDFLQQQSQIGDVPFAIAQRVDEAALNVLFGDLERQIEGAACRDDAEVFVEDQEGLANGVDDRLRERASIIDIH